MRRWFWLVLSVLTLFLASSVTAQMTPEEQGLVDTYIRYMEVWETAEFDVLEEVVTPDYVRHSQWGPDTHGIEEVAESITGFLESFGQGTAHEFVEGYAKGDRAFVTGLITPPGEEGFPYSTLVRFEDGMMVEQWSADNPMLVLDLFESTDQTTGAFASMDGADSASVIINIYKAVNNGDVDGAMDQIADDAVLTILMGDEPIIHTGKTAIRDWLAYLASENFLGEIRDATVQGNRTTMLLDTNSPEVFDFDFQFEGVAIVREGLMHSVTWVATPETLANLATANARAAEDAAVTFQTSLLAEPPADATVVEAFSVEKIMCEGLSEWSVDASPEDWTHVHAKWMTITEDILAESWPLVDIRISVDGQEVADVARFAHGPVPLEVVCGEDATAGTAMEIDFFVPPMPEGEHTVAWEYVIKEAHNDGWDDIDAGQYGLFTAHLGVNHNAEMIDAVLARTDMLNALEAAAATAPFADNATYNVLFAEGLGMEDVRLTGKDAILERISSFVPLNMVSTTRILRIEGNTVYDLGTFTDDAIKADGLDHIVTYNATTFENGEIVDYTVTVMDFVPLETSMTEHVVNDVQELVGRWQTSLMGGLAHMNVDADGSVEITYPVAGTDASWAKGELWIEGSTLNVQWLGEQDPVTYEVHMQMIGENPVHLSFFDIYDPVPERVEDFSAGMNFVER